MDWRAFASDKDRFARRPSGEGADFSSASGDFKALGAFFCNSAALSFLPESRTVNRAPVYHILCLKASETLPFPGADLIFSSRCGAMTPFCLRAPRARAQSTLSVIAQTNPKCYFNLKTAIGLFPFGGESGIFSGMTQDLPPIAVHPTGEQSVVALGGAAAAPQPLVVDSFAGSVRVEWDHATAFTPLGQLPFFIDFLKTAGLFDSFVADSPLNYESPNASKTRDVLGTAMLSMLAGHKRYSHIAALRGDGVLPELLGMRKIVSEDSVRRAFAAIEEEAGAAWMRRHLDHCLEPLLSERWILDIDTTVKPLYGRQEGAVVGYNPKKPGRPSHCYHTYSMAGTRLVFDVDVCAGDEHASHHAAPALWALLDRTARDCWPALLRGDKGFGNEKIMREAELRELAYLFKLRLTANVRRAIERLSQQSEWVELRSRLAGQGDSGSIERLEPTTPHHRAATTREGRACNTLDRRCGTAAAHFRRYPSERGAMGISGSSDFARRASGELRPALSRPR